MDTFLQDLRLALRSLRRNPGFGAAALLTLALGIGGTCAIFAVVNDVFWRKLPFADEGRLLRLRDSSRSPGGVVSTVNTSGRHFLEIAAQTKSLAGLTGERGHSATLTGVDVPERVGSVLLTPGSLALLGIRPVAGRSFAPEEEDAGEQSGVALISNALWKRRFGGEQAALDHTLEVDGRPLRVIGVLPPGYRFPYDADVYLPLRLTPEDSDDLAVFARLAPGVTLDAARAELQAIAARMPERDARTLAGYGIDATPLRQSLIDDRDKVAVALLVVLGFFLLLACVNVAMLLLARSVSRQRELAIRSALGAGRLRQARQLFTESGTLAILGGALGLVFAGWLSPLLGTLVPSNLSEQLGMNEAPLDWRVPAFAISLSLLTALLAGAAPALQATRPDLEQVLKGSGKGAEPLRHRRLLGSFVAGQIALGVVLLCGAGLVIENFRLLQGSDLGFDPQQLYTADLSLPSSRYREPAARARFFEQLLPRLTSAAGISAAGTTSVNPLRGGTWSAPIAVEGREEDARAASDMVNHRLVSPGLLSAMRIPLLRGRELDARDVVGSPPVVIVSARLANRLWSGQDPLGKRLRVGRAGTPWLTVVGVAGDVRDEGDQHEAWYLPLLQNPQSGAAETLVLMVRSALEPEPLIRTLRAAVAAVDPQLALDGFAPMQEVRKQALAQERLGATTVSLFALLGLLLAAVGTYGVMAYALARRTREIGIRLALGAAPRDVLLLLLREGLWPAFAGIALGLGAALASHRLLAARLTEVGAINPALLSAVAGLFLLVALIAVWLPGRRATAVDPSITLRAE